MKTVHKAFALVLSLALTAALLSGCTVTSPKDPEFRKDWNESMDELQKDLDDLKDEEGKRHYWEIQDAAGETLYTVDEDEKVKALDDLLADEHGTTWKDTDEDPGEAAYSYLYCQEKTLLAGQDPEEERDYEALMRFTVSAEKDIITLKIMEDEDFVKLFGENEFLVFSEAIPAETAEALRNPAVLAE